jgi:hypothetical protein
MELKRFLTASGTEPFLHVWYNNTSAKAAAYKATMDITATLAAVAVY